MHTITTWLVVIQVKVIRHKAATSSTKPVVQLPRLSSKTLKTTLKPWKTGQMHLLRVKGVHSCGVGMECCSNRRRGQRIKYLIVSSRIIQGRHLVRWDLIMIKCRGRWMVQSRTKRDSHQARALAPTSPQTTVQAARIVYKVWEVAAFHSATTICHQIRQLTSRKEVICIIQKTFRTREIVILIMSHGEMVADSRVKPVTEEAKCHLSTARTPLNNPTSQRKWSITSL